LDARARRPGLERGSHRPRTPAPEDHSAQPRALVAAGRALTIRKARPEDWQAIWPFFHEIVAAGETYAYDRDTTEADGRRMWMVGPPGRTVVATDREGAVLGTANMYANRPGPGTHVASASFMV